jgi:hypothetical protein
MDPSVDDIPTSQIHSLGTHYRDADRRRRLETLPELPWEATDGVIRRVVANHLALAVVEHEIPTTIT